MTIVIGGNGAGKTTWCRQHPHELPEAFYNPDAIAQDLGDWNNMMRPYRWIGVRMMRSPRTSATGTTPGISSKLAGL